MPAERRRHVRHPLLAQVQVAADGDVMVWVTENISFGGIFISAGEQDELLLEKGDVVEVFVDVPVPYTARSIELCAKGRVVRCADGSGPRGQRGFALLWTELDAEHWRRLAEIIRMLRRRTGQSR